MLCAELEQMEGELDDIITALENPSLTEPERKSLQDDYTRLSHIIKDHQNSGHQGHPCFEE